MSIDQLPFEVLEQVFKNLDGVTFSVAREVCKMWYTVVHTMKKDQLLWRKFCIKEIPNGMIEEILSFNYIPKNPDINWSNIYLRWYKGRMVKRKDFMKNTIPAFCSNPVTCMKVSGSWIITGHSNGYICVWDMFDRIPYQTHHCHLKTVTDMALVDLLNIGVYYGADNFHWSHHHIITVSKDTVIKVKSLLESIQATDSDIILNRHGDACTSVKVFGKHFVVSSRDNTITLWIMRVDKKPYFHLDVAPIVTIIGPADILMTIGLWYDKICCISIGGRLKVLDLRKNEWSEQTYFRKCWDKCEHKLVCITEYYIFRHQTVIFFTADGRMIISIGENNSQEYHLIRPLRSLIVSVALHGTVLALGGENGRLYLFHVHETKSLLSLDLYNPTFSTRLSEASIVAIDIIYDYYTPIVVATTTESLFVIKWHSGCEQETKNMDVKRLVTNSTLASCETLLHPSPPIQ